VTRSVPDAEQGRSYGMAAFRAYGRPLLGFTVRENHMSLHPFSPAVVEAVADQSPDIRFRKGRSRSQPTTQSPRP
jgi:uncharacterized protein YdhG (YjbR/CyaY superfamily)